MTSESSQHDVPPIDTPVVIVGAGPVGMFLALDLASRGVRCTVIERATSHRSYPKGDTHNARTMEHYRRVGLSAAIRRAGLRAGTLDRRGVPHPPQWLRAQTAAHADRGGEDGGGRAALGDQPGTEPLHRSNQVHVEKVVFEHLLRTESVSCRLGMEFSDTRRAPRE